jgi:hypothetical protein
MMDLYNQLPIFNHTRLSFINLIRFTSKYLQIDDQVIGDMQYKQIQIQDIQPEQTGKRKKKKNYKY